MQRQEMSGIEMYDMKDTRIFFFKVKEKKQSLKLSLLVIFTPLINKEVEEGMQTCEAGSRLFPLSSLCHVSRSIMVVRFCHGSSKGDDKPHGDYPGYRFQHCPHARIHDSANQQDKWNG